MRRFVSGTIVGALLGAVAALLLAPRSGEETRNEIKARATKAKDVAGDKLDEASKKVKKAVDKEV